METPYTVAAAILAEVLEAFAAQSVTIGHSMVAVGAVMLDGCCDGSLIVAPERVYRIDSTAGFPAEASVDGRCGNLIGVDMLVRVDRCVPVIEAGLNGRIKVPSDAAQEEAFRIVLRDAAIVWNAVVSEAMLGEDEEWERASVVQRYDGPQGDCLASETRFTIGIDKDSWCLLTS